MQRRSPDNADGKSVLQHLVSKGLLTAVGLERAERLVGESNEALASVLTRIGIVSESEKDLAQAFSELTGIPQTYAHDYPAEPGLVGELSSKFLRRFMVVPLACRTAQDATAEAIERLGLDRMTDERPIRLWEAKGCEACGGTGYSGRASILKVLVMSDAIRQLILRRAEAREIESQAIAEGMRSMQQHGFAKALAGETTVAEVLRATRDG